jgi:hypothetical protein
VPISTLLKEEQTEFPNTFQPNLQHSINDLTDHVDHIQSSLDNIRDLMFDSLPEGTSMEDLFGEDHGLLSPILEAASNNNPTANLLLENLQDQKLISGDHTSDLIESTNHSQSVPNVNNQLLEQLITESVLIDEQRETINQLAREKSDLENKIHLLEQQTTQQK